MRKYLCFIALLFLLISCRKENDSEVSYVVTRAISGFDVSFRDAHGNVVSEWIETSSAEDRWKYSYTASEGDIVYVSARYYDISSAIQVQIIIDGKVYKQGSSAQDTVRYVTVSGTVPIQ